MKLVIFMMLVLGQAWAADGPCEAEKLSPNILCNPNANSCPPDYQCLAADGNSGNNSCEISDGACNSGSDCCSGVCEEVIDAIAPAPAKRCLKLENPQDLYFSNNPSCQLTQATCFANNECCSNNCINSNPLTGLGPTNPGKCAKPFACIKNLANGDALCGVAKCGQESVPKSVNSNDFVMEQLIPVAGHCALPYCPGGTGSDGDQNCPAPKPTNAQNEMVVNAEGSSCKISMDAASIKNFVEQDGLVLAAEYVMSEHTPSGKYDDHAGYLKTAHHSIGIQLRDTRKALDEAFLQVYSGVLAEMGQIEANPQSDPLGITMLNLQATLVETVAAMELARADFYGKIKYKTLPSGGQEPAVDANGNLEFENTGMVKTTEDFAKKIQKFNPSCRKVVSSKGIFVACLKKCKGNFKRNKDCGRVDTLIENASTGDPLIPKNLRALNSVNLPAIDADLVLYAQTPESKISRKYEYTNEQDAEFSEFNGNYKDRLMGLKDVAIRARDLMFFYGRGKKNKLPGATKAQAIQNLAFAMEELKLFYGKIYPLRVAQAKCLKAVAAKRLADSTPGVVLENIKGQELAPNQVLLDAPFIFNTDDFNKGKGEFIGLGLPGVSQLQTSTTNSELDEESGDSNLTPSNLSSQNLGQGAFNGTDKGALNTANNSAKNLPAALNSNPGFLALSKINQKLEKKRELAPNDIRNANDASRPASKAESVLKRVKPDNNVSGSGLNLKNQSTNNQLSAFQSGGSSDYGNQEGIENNQDQSGSNNRLYDENYKPQFTKEETTANEEDSIFSIMSKAYFRQVYPQVFESGTSGRTPASAPNAK